MDLRTENRTVPPKSRQAATLMDIVTVTVTVILHGLDSPNPSCNWVTGRVHCGEASLSLHEVVFWTIQKKKIATLQ